MGSTGTMLVEDMTIEELRTEVHRLRELVWSLGRDLQAADVCLARLSSKALDS